MDKIEKDFNKFSPKDYLNEYYANIGFENKNLLKFFDKIYKGLNHKDKLLEFGGGPTIYQLISARKKVNEIIFSDYNKNNLDEIKKWLDNSDNAFNWNEWFEFVLKLEQQEKTSENVKQAKKELQSKIINVIQCDAFKDHPLGNSKYVKYFDIISVNFVPESATDNEKDYLLFLKNIFSMMKPGGLLVMTLLKGAEYYHVGDMKFPAFPIKDEEHIKKILSQFGFIDIETESIEAEDEQGYDGMIFLTATMQSD